MIIQRSDKGNLIVPINKKNYLDKMNNFLSDSKKIVKYSVMDEKHLNFIIGIEKKLTSLLKELKASETISEIHYKKLKARGSSFGVLYGLCKTPKKVLDKCLPFRPILSAIKTPSYNLGQFLVPLIEPITKTVLQFKIVLNFLRKYLNKIQNTLCLFDCIIYEKIDGVAMGSPLGPSLVNTFLAHYEQIWLNDCPNRFKPVYCKKYVDNNICSILTSSPCSKIQ